MKIKKGCADGFTGKVNPGLFAWRTAAHFFSLDYPTVTGKYNCSSWGGGPKNTPIKPFVFDDPRIHPPLVFVSVLIVWGADTFFLLFYQSC